MLLSETGAGLQTVNGAWENESIPGDVVADIWVATFSFEFAMLIEFSFLFL